MEPSAEDIQALVSGEEINDKVINAYLHLVQQRGTGKNVPRVYCFNSFFLDALLRRGYDGVKGWTKKRDILRFDLLVFPYFQEARRHWTVIIADFRKKTILGFDSTYETQETAIEKVLDYLSSEAWHKKGAVFHQRKWTVEENRGPRQYSKTDCGVFACMTAEAYAVDRKIDFSQTDMKRLRLVMAEELRLKQILSHAPPPPKIAGLTLPKQPKPRRVSRKPSPLATPIRVPRAPSPSPPRKPAIKKDVAPPLDLIVPIEISSASSSSSEEEMLTLYYEQDPLGDIPTADEILDDWDIISLGEDCQGLTSPEGTPSANTPQPNPQDTSLVRTSQAETSAPITDPSPEPEATPMEEDAPPSKRRKSRQRKFRQREGNSTSRVFREDRASD